MNLSMALFLTVAGMNLPGVLGVAAMLFVLAFRLFGVYGRWTPSKESDQ